MTCGVSRSNSSWIGPTSSSRTFSRLTMPTTLPYSSSSIARWTRLRWNSTSRWSSWSVSGRNGTLRATLRRSGRPLLDAPERKRSLTWIMPMTVVRSSSQSGIPRVPGLPRDPEVVLERSRQAQVDDVGAGDHHPTGRLLLEVQDVLDHDPLAAREVPPGDALGDDMAQLFLGVRHLGVVGPAQAQEPEGQVAGVVEQPDDRPEDVVEGDQRRAPSAGPRSSPTGWPGSWGPARRGPCAGT